MGRAAMLGRGLNAIGVILMGLAVGPAGVVIAYLFTYAMHGMNGPPHAAILHRVASASNRSTVLSLNSMVAFAAFAAASPIAGWASERASITATILGLGAVEPDWRAGLPARPASQLRMLTKSPQHPTSQTDLG